MAVLSDCSFDFFTGQGRIMVEVEEAHVQVQAVQRGMQPGGIGIGDQDLSEALAAEQFQQVAHTLGVDLVEYVVQQ
jgi:hypothetical protein